MTITAGSIYTTPELEKPVPPGQIINNQLIWV